MAYIQLRPGPVGITHTIWRGYDHGLSVDVDKDQMAGSISSEARTDIGWLKTNLCIPVSDLRILAINTNIS
jgi:hypothetical protein